MIKVTQWRIKLIINFFYGLRINYASCLEHSISNNNKLLYINNAIDRDYIEFAKSKLVQTNFIMVFAEPMSLLRKNLHN